MPVPRLAELYPTAFVTGTSAGLGRAFAAMLLGEGVRVWGTARDPARLGELGARYPSLFTPVALDLADAPAAGAAFAAAAGTAGGFDLVIQNAGYGGTFGEFSVVDFAGWQAQLEAMLLTTARLSQAALQPMRERKRGCLVHISSIAAEFPLPFLSGYNVAKAGLSALSESLIFECRRTGVTVIDFRPGDYRTDFNQAMQSTLTVPAADARLARAWQILEANLEAAPPPVRAAADLRRALLRRRSGVVRSGSFFQARLSPFLARLAPASYVRAAVARYFGS